MLLSRARHLTHRTLLAATLLSLAACGGGSGGGGTSGIPSGAGSGDFLLQDGPVSSLLSFTATVNEVRLDITGGGTTANLLPSPVTVEFLGLQGTLGWLASVDPLPTGSFDGASIVFAPMSYSARALDGTDVTVSALSDTLTINFASPIVVDGTDYHRFAIDLDLFSSLTGSVGSPPLTFDPSGSGTGDDGSVLLDIDEIKGVVKEVRQAKDVVLLDAFVDEDLLLPLGEVAVKLSSTTLLFQESGAAYADQSSFYGDLVATQTLLEVHGKLAADSSIRAEKIDIEDQTAGASSSGIVKIEGIVADVTAGVSFDLTIREIEKGSAVATPVLSGLGSPSTITVSFDMMTAFFRGSSTLANSSGLVIGQEVKVRFSTFATSPFPASRVELDDDLPEYRGMITDIAGLPGSAIIHLDNQGPHVLSGAVASSTTDVAVDLSATTITLDTEGDPVLPQTYIVVGQEVNIEGTLSGTPTAPMLAAVKAEVEPGRFKDGVVSGTTSSVPMFTTSSSTIEDSFGAGITNGPLNVMIDSAAVFDGDASTQAEFFALFTNLQMGETLEVEVKGVATGNPNEVMAYEIDAQVQ